MKKKILIVDDDINDLKLLGLILERDGYEIATASGGVQGLTEAYAEAPDLILLDVLMPDLDGLELAQRLRNDPTLEQVPIIMVTAKSMPDDKLAGFQAGASDYIIKPFSSDDLLGRVNTVLDRFDKSREMLSTRDGEMISRLSASQESMSNLKPWVRSIWEVASAAQMSESDARELAEQALPSLRPILTKRTEVPPASSGKMKV